MLVMGQRIRQKRLELGLTQEELGQKLGIKKSVVIYVQLLCNSQTNEKRQI